MLAVGARLLGQASSSWPISSVTVAKRARSQSLVETSAITGSASCLSTLASAMTSSVLPPKESSSATSEDRSLPRSPCIASVGCRKWLGVPVEASVAEIFWPMIPLLPKPETTTLPWELLSGSVRSSTSCTAS